MPLQRLLWLFQSTLLRRSDDNPCFQGYPHKYFNPRSCEGATDHSHSNTAYYNNFNPRSCEGATPIDNEGCTLS